jgi:hypothetical protein
VRDDGEPHDVEVVVRDHGQPERAGMPFFVRLPSAARPNIVRRILLWTKCCSLVTPV